MGGGAVKCWGYNREGQLGNGQMHDRSHQPTTVVGISGAVEIGVGAGSCARMSNGHVKCRGTNGLGERGDGTFTNSAVPLDLVGITDAVQIASGDNHSCALRATGTVRCWGYNFNGELGDGTNTTSNVPVDVVGLSGVTGATAVMAGNHTSCALFPGGTAKCWGSNESDHLGNGTSSYRSFVPVDVVGLSGITAMSATVVRTCALLGGGAVKCWGSNDHGQLGDGTVVDSLHPVAVLRPV